MEDIKVISGGYVQGSYLLLDKTSDRVNASIYFLRKIPDVIETDTKYAEWYFRASLSEFKSIFDVLSADLKRKNLKNEWKKSKQRELLEADPLVRIVKKARDLAIHSVVLPGERKNWKVTYCDKNGSTTKTLRRLFFDQIDRSDHADLNKVPEEHIDWFNRQSHNWPADLIIQEAIYQSSVYLSNFLLAQDRDRSG